MLLLCVWSLQVGWVSGGCGGCDCCGCGGHNVGGGVILEMVLLPAGDDGFDGDDDDCGGDYGYGCDDGSDDRCCGYYGYGCDDGGDGGCDDDFNNNNNSVINTINKSICCYK